MNVQNPDNPTPENISDGNISGRLLAPYRVLDLTEGGTQICGKILADLGADVVKVEPPDGSPSRNIGPFYKNVVQKEKSLFWFSYNVNKRSITLNLHKAEGQDIFRQLVKGIDMVLESFTPAYLKKLGLNYETISTLNPDVVMTSITPFGQKGPKANYRSCDLTSWASGGILYISGDRDRAPCWVSFPQASLHAGAQAAAASLLALFHRRVLGEGQHVDVSIQDCMIRIITNAHLITEFTGQEIIRAGNSWAVGTSSHRTQVRMGFRCKDGFVAVNLFGGGNAGIVNATRKVVQWMDEEGMAPSWLKEFDWVHDYDASHMSPEVIDRVEEQWARFFLTKTKAEIFTETIKRGLPLAPVNTSEDIWESIHLKARDYWQEVEHPELGEYITYNGSFAKVSGTSLGIRKRPPTIGEHNQEIYGRELGITEKNITRLKNAGVI